MTNDTTGTFEKLQNARAQILEILKAEGFELYVNEYYDIYITNPMEDVDKQLWCPLDEELE
jgi:hypothetical protein